jgi:hypothetical protein
VLAPTSPVIPLLESYMVMSVVIPLVFILFILQGTKFIILFQTRTGLVKLMGGLAPPSQTVGFLLRALEGRQRLLETPNLTKEDTTVYFMSVVGRFELKMAPKFEIWVETKRNENVNSNFLSFMSSPVPPM